jgi:lysophospholipid acyltransferase (LPLAT)-like uncharacterized protein
LFKKIKIWLSSFIVFCVYRLWISTWRQTLLENDDLRDDIKNNRPVIFALWHGHELAMISFSKYYNVVTMTSISSDGQIMDGALQRLGIATTKGSSSKEAVQGLKGLIRMGKSGYQPVVPVDGPKGPIYEPKPGVFELSRLLNARIYPGGLASSSQITFEKSWNKAFLPKPFARVVLYWEKPLEIVSRDEDPRSPELAQKLKMALNAAGQQARKQIAQPE